LLSVREVNSASGNQTIGGSSGEEEEVSGYRINCSGRWGKRKTLNKTFKKKSFSSNADRGCMYARQVV